MKKKILATSLIGIFLTFIIYKVFYHEKVSIVTLGDNLSLGYTAYHIRGYSFNDYLKDYYENKKITLKYTTSFSHEYETTETLLLKLENNYTLDNKESITEAIYSSSVLTLALGMEELNSKTKITTKEINNYLENMTKILKILDIYNKKQIFLISLYPTHKLSLKQVKELNNNLKEIANLYHTTFIDITDITTNKDYFFDNDNYELNYKGHKYISEKIINCL